MFNIFLARATGVEDYGVFAFAYTALVLTSTIWSAIILEPFVIEWQDNAEDIGSYVRKSIFANVILAFAGVLIIVLASAILVSAFSVPVIFCVLFAINFAFATFQWLFRQMAYADLRPWAAVAQMAVYATVLLGSAIWLAQYSNFTSSTAIAALATASSASVGAGLLVHKHLFRKGTSRGWPQLVGRWFEYGRWSLPGAVATWLAANIFLMALPALGQMGSAGKLKAFLNLLLPFQQILQGASLLMQPLLAREQTADRPQHLRVLRKYYLAAGTAGGVLFSLVIYFFGPLLMSLLYGSEYQMPTDQLGYAVLLISSMAPLAVMRTTLRAARMPRESFMPYLITLLVLGPVVVPIGSGNGLAGAIVGMSIVQVATLVLMTRSYLPLIYSKVR